MIMTKDNDFFGSENDLMDMASMSVLGDRLAQEDCCGYQTRGDCFLLCVCDGMGGYSGGSMASRAAVSAILREFENGPSVDNPVEYLNELTLKANREVLAIRNGRPDTPNAGTTLVMVLIKDHLLYWSAVGDSRLYICRKTEFIQMTKDQNYHTVLNEKRNAGEITDDEYEQGKVRGDALVNYLGINQLHLIDYNTEPLKLKSEDRLLICTDGLYRILSDEELMGILNVGTDARSTLQMMEFSVRKKSKERNIRRDNMTVSLIKVR